MPSHTIVNKDAIGGNQLIKAIIPVLAATTSITSFVSSMLCNPFLFFTDCSGCNKAQYCYTACDDATYHSLSCGADRQKAYIALKDA